MYLNNGGDSIFPIITCMILKSVINYGVKNYLLDKDKAKKFEALLSDMAKDI